MENSKSKIPSNGEIVQPTNISNTPPVIIQKESTFAIYRKDPKFFLALGAAFFGLILFSCTLAISVRHANLPDSPVLHIEYMDKVIPLTDRPTEQESLTRLEALFTALGDTKLENTTKSHSIEALTLNYWNAPTADKTYKEGDTVTAEGTYTIPEDTIALITVTENNKVVGTQLINNTGKSQETKDFSINLGTYKKGKKDYAITLDGVASCRLLCSPLDTACQATNTNYCGIDFTNERLLNFEPRTIGIADLYTDKTCLVKEFSSGPMNSTAPDSCATEGFKSPYFIQATAFINAFRIPVTTKQMFAQDVSTQYTALTSGSGATMVRRDQGEASWTFDYKKSAENDTGMCMGKVTVKVYCPKE